MESNVLTSSRYSINLLDFIHLQENKTFDFHNFTIHHQEVAFIWYLLELQGQEMYVSIIMYVSKEYHRSYVY